MVTQSPAPASTLSSRASSLSNNPALGFVPWIIFWVVAGPRTWEVASGCALLASVMLLAIDVGGPMLERALAAGAGLSPDPRERLDQHERPDPSDRSAPRRRREVRTPKILDLGTAVFFLALVVIGFFVDRQDLIGLEKYSQAISSAALGLIVILSIALGHPFTEQYAREGVPESLWHTPLFRRTMLIMSSVWAAIFAVTAILGVAYQTGITGAGSNDLVNWYIPIGLVILGFKFNDWYPSYIQRLAAEHRP